MLQKINLPLMQEADLKDKVVLVRVDHNVVKKGLIHDPYRIDSTIATLFNIVARGGKLMLMSHVGRPKNKKTGEIITDDNTSVKPIAKYLEQKLNLRILTPEFDNSDNKGYQNMDSSMKSLIEDLKNDKADCIYLPNTRWFAGEEAKDEKAEAFAKNMAEYADVYINDAFGSWQAHTSTVGICKTLPSYAGLLMQKEIENLDRIYSPKRPFIAVVAGSKFDTKIESLNALLETADHLVLGGVIYNAYLCAKYGIEIKGISEEDLEQAKSFVDYCKKFPGKLVELPIIIESDTLDGKFEGQYRTHDVRELKPGHKLNFVLDVAKESFEIPEVKAVFEGAKMFFVNAVMGFTPNFGEGTIALNTIIDQNKEAVKLFGGGDTLQDFKALLPGVYLTAIDDPKYYMFTGGGAVLKAIQEGKVTGLAPVEALINANK